MDKRTRLVRLARVYQEMALLVGKYGTAENAYRCSPRYRELSQHAYHLQSETAKRRYR